MRELHLRIRRPRHQALARHRARGLRCEGNRAARASQSPRADQPPHQRAASPPSALWPLGQRVVWVSLWRVLGTPAMGTPTVNLLGFRRVSVTRTWRAPRRRRRRVRDTSWVLPMCDQSPYTRATTPQWSFASQPINSPRTPPPQSARSRGLTQADLPEPTRPMGTTEAPVAATRARPEALSQAKAHARSACDSRANLDPSRPRSAGTLSVEISHSSLCLQR